MKYPVAKLIYFPKEFLSSHSIVQIIVGAKQWPQRPLSHWKEHGSLHQCSSRSSLNVPFSSFISAGELQQDPSSRLALHALLSSEEILAKWEP